VTPALLACRALVVNAETPEGQAESLVLAQSAHGPAGRQINIYSLSFRFLLLFQKQSLRQLLSSICTFNIHKMNNLIFT
jgi:hypothetical protein